jgi:hypothetical protein
VDKRQVRKGFRQCRPRRSTRQDWRRRVSIIRVLLRFDGHHQASFLKERDNTIMAGVIREDLHFASGLRFDRFAVILIPMGMLDTRLESRVPSYFRQVESVRYRA